MNVPAYLKKGDLIGIVSTASTVKPKIIESAVELLQSLGYKVLLGEHVFDQHHQFAGKDGHRKADLQSMLNHAEVKAILCSRGGYGTIRTIEHIDWSYFVTNPKWLIGFSDVTVLHSQLNTLGIASIHGVMPRYFKNDEENTESFNYLINALEGKENKYTIAPSEFNKPGNCSGELVGGNLSILYSLRGTNLDIDTTDKILFIEDLSEYLYHIDRMMMNLKIGGKLQNLSGLIVGSFTNLKDNEIPYGKSFEEIILDAVTDYKYPVMFNFPAGHQADNFALKFGCKAQLQVGSNHVEFQQ